jgi:hypothetical protein
VPITDSTPPVAKQLANGSGAHEAFNVGLYLVLA